MVTNTGDGIESSTVARSSRVEHLGQGALLLAAVALIVAFVPTVREFAWIPAVPAVLVALIAMGADEGRKRYATGALLLGWFAFSYSFAMMLWG